MNHVAKHEPDGVTKKIIEEFVLGGELAKGLQCSHHDNVRIFRRQLKHQV